MLGLARHTTQVPSFEGQYVIRISAHFTPWDSFYPVYATALDWSNLVSRIGSSEIPDFALILYCSVLEIRLHAHIKCHRRSPRSPRSIWYLGSRRCHLVIFLPTLPASSCLFGPTLASSPTMCIVNGIPYQSRNLLARAKKQYRKYHSARDVTDCFVRTGPREMCGDGVAWNNTFWILFPVIILESDIPPSGEDANRRIIIKHGIPTILFSSYEIPWSSKLVSVRLKKRK